MIMMEKMINNTFLMKHFPRFYMFTITKDNDIQRILMYVSISITTHDKEIIIKKSYEIYNYRRNFHISYA